ncbi:CDP-diacylglycerol--glycerol-3-phosphate 3-phosphatidyltransferase [Candidatus Viridilinea mediisalina]|uniref:CDP-diacylglycerol--glycerol-3-phosphate 3-phosphatidyltransferase n=1 Tax=Candidatus Viridilinea mediisalina TaxID=2024553 RepID=A0A2A6RN72_9CHLR|nr:CDP-diacylglycerol--glycerol-3-phosphate 3-phosphatidyltransferase [Candidatus Viridilinea mediisalina]PDW04375.1 CDP-diacylglycerol--glycerol-3-phosphate 3-phosphatidyltransferase [Candidatus Viridilinea mediisalina]
MRSLPNLLGLFRIVTTPLLFGLILMADPVADMAAIALLLLMALSDIADGKIARRMQVVSPFGVFLDTISDKIFVVGALLPMVQLGMLPGWVAFVIIVREFVISGLRSFAAAEGVVIAAGKLGKQKLTITVTALIWRLLASSAERGGLMGTMFGGILVPPLQLWPIVMGLALIWTVASALEYLRHAWPLLRRSWEPR